MQPQSKRAIITDLSDVPIILGVIILLCADIFVWLSHSIAHHRMMKGGISTLIIALVLDVLVQILPFVLIRDVIRGLIRGKTGTAEIHFKMAFILTPVCILTAYWQMTYIDPFARALLLLMNLVLLVLSNLLGRVVFALVQK